MRRRKPDRYDWLITLGFILLISLGIYVAVWAPCGAIDWLPAREVPARCLR